MKTPAIPDRFSGELSAVTNDRHELYDEKSRFNRSFLSRRSLLKNLSFAMLGLSLSASLGSHAGASQSSVSDLLLAQRRTLRVGYQKSGSFNLLRHRGNFEKRLKALGVAVTWSEFTSGPPLLEALAAGSIDLGQTGDAPPVFAQAKGDGIVYIGQSDKSPDSVGILVPQNSSIRSIAQLKGKKVAFAKGSSAHYFIVRALATAKLSLKDVTPVYLQPPDARAAFERGAIDAWAIWDPFFAAAERDAKARLLINGKGLTPFREFYLADRKFANNNPDLIPVIIQELRALGNWAIANRQKSAEFLADKTKINVDILEVSERRRVGRYRTSNITAEAIAEQQQIADTFLAAGLIPKKIKVSDAVWRPRSQR
ncbi:sulfonate ABC transporter substrate-binding protein [Synechococcus elongatus]|uniref:sulfonate ABC transporter substrate-binding protein n=1 Tax=Synechococcus elongatus TaxID=32046 RepID=UPI001C9B93FC|nr:sulfonate ABC transporter substrate-binding protein [Synechococcus elongatus]